jgi:hypothetical protein
MIGGLIVVIAHVRSSILARRKRQSFQRRESLSPQEVVTRYYANTGLDMTIVLAIWNECARHLKVPVDKLRPTDRFDRELAPADFIVVDLKTPASIDDLIRQLAIHK